MKLSFVATVYNEENTIKLFIESILTQSVPPDEIIIVDGGSKDKTVAVLNAYKSKVTVFIQPGNRSVGRNFGIQKARSDNILISDAGCILDKKWAEAISKPLENKAIDVVSGFYEPIAETTFERCLATYTCVMPDRVDPATFLPSSRSIAFRKSAWEAVGGYPEDLDTCEDLVFAAHLRKKDMQFVFAKDAIVYWPQQKTLTEAFLQFYRYAIGDGKAFYIRPQTPLLFLRYLLGVLLFVWFVVTQNFFLLFFLFVLFFSYLLWAIAKNYRYVDQWQALYYLPLLQLTADIAVLFGTTRGIIKGRQKK